MPYFTCALGTADIAVPGLLPVEKDPERTCLFYSHNHRQFACRRLGAQIAEACFLHPADQLLVGVVEATFGHDEHVEARQEAGSIGLPRVVNHPLIDDKRTRWGKRVVRLS